MPSCGNSPSWRRVGNRWISGFFWHRNRRESARVLSLQETPPAARGTWARYLYPVGQQGETYSRERSTVIMQVRHS